LQFSYYCLPHNNSALKAIKVAWNWVQERRNFKLSTQNLQQNSLWNRMENWKDY
jgi:hypothetical protein